MPRVIKLQSIGVYNKLHFQVDKSTRIKFLFQGASVPCSPKSNFIIKRYGAICYIHSIVNIRSNLNHIFLINKNSEICM